VIASDAELELARKNLANVEAAIESLRKELLPHHERNFNLYARPWLDFRDQFQADIDAYLRAKTTPAKGAAGSVEPTETKALEPAGEDRAGSKQIT
jgi:hypothetical protein